MIRIVIVAAVAMLAGTSAIAQGPFKPSNYTSNTYAAIYLVKKCGLAQPGDQERLDYLDSWSAKYEKRGAYSAQQANIDALAANPQFMATYCKAAQSPRNAEMRAKWDEHIEMAKTYERKLATGER